MPDVLDEERQAQGSAQPAEPWKDFQTGEEGPWTDFQAGKAATPVNTGPGGYQIEPLQTEPTTRSATLPKPTQAAEVFGETYQKGVEGTLSGLKALPEQVGSALINLPGRLLAADTGYDVPDVAQPGKPIISPENMTSLRRMATGPLSTAVEKFAAAKIPAYAGLQTAADKAVSGFTTPGGIVTLPFLAAKPVQVAFAAQMALQAPETVKTTMAVLNDPKATAEQKWEALGDAGIQLAMAAALAHGMTVKEFKTRFTPEQAAKDTANLPPLPRAQAEAAKEAGVEQSPQAELDSVNKSLDEWEKKYGPRDEIDPETGRPRPYRVLNPEEDILLKRQGELNEQILRAQPSTPPKAQPAPANPEMQDVGNNLKIAAIMRARNKLVAEGASQSDPRVLRLDKAAKDLIDEHVAEGNEEINKQLKGEPNAVPEQKPDSGVLRQEPEGVGLPPVGEGDAKPQKAAGEEEGVPPGARPAPREVQVSQAAEIAQHPTDQPFPTGYSKEAVRYGASLTKPEQVQELLTLAEQVQTKLREVPKSPENLGRIQTEGSKLHWLNEALEAATGAGGDKDAVHKEFVGADYKAPFPEFEEHRYLLRHGMDRATREAKEAAEIQAIRHGAPAEPPAKLTAAAVRTPEGKVETGPHHPGILERLGIKGFEKRESRNTPMFGFVDEQGKFLTRPEAAERAKQTGQQMESFEKDEKGVEQPHSDEVASLTNPDKPVENLTPEQVYDAALAKSREATRAFWVKQEAYRARTIGDEEFLKARADFDAAMKDFDAAEKAFIDAKNKLSPAEKKPPEPPGPTGMGGAVPGEFGASPNTPTSIKNAVVDQERAARGLPPAMQPLRRSFGDVWAKAMAHIDNDPAWLYGDKTSPGLIEELKRKPRALTDEEDAALLYHQVDLQNDYGKATRDLAQHFEDGNEGMVQASKLRIAGLSDQLLDLYNIGKTSGTETARGLNARKMMANEDFTLAKMELDKRAANGGRRLTEDESAELSRLHARIAETQKRLDEHMATSDARIAELEVKAALDRVKLEAAQKMDPVIKRIVTRIGDALHSQRDAARARIKARMKEGRTNLNIDPTELADYAIVGASHLFDGALGLAEWSQKMVSDFGEGIKEHLPAIFEEANKRFDATIDAAAGKKQAAGVKKAVRDPAERAAGITSKIADKINDGKRNEIASLVQKLARTFVERGITERVPLVNALHEVVSTIDPSFTWRETMDAFSGYGDFKQLSKDAISTQVRDLKGQSQQVGKLLDMFQNEPPLKSGPERRTPTDTERRLIQQVNEIKKRFGITTTDPATQLKSALQSLKTRLRNQILDLESQLASKTRTVAERTPGPEDVESKALKTRRDVLKAEFDEMFGKPEMTDAQRVKLALASLDRQSAEIERQIKEGDIFPTERKSRTPNTAELDAAREKRDALKEEREYLRESIQPTQRRTQEEISLMALKTRLRNRTKELQDKIAAGDFAPKQRRELKLDAEAMRLKAENERAKEEFRRNVMKDRLKQRSHWEKTMDTLVKWRRAFLLSGPTTLAKLTSAAIQRISITPAEEAIGGGLSAAFPSIARRAAREGGVSTRAEAKALSEGFTKGMRDAWQVLRTGRSDLDVLYGKDKGYPNELVNFMGNLHGALKTVTKRNEFARSLQKRVESAMNGGIDVSDPMVQTRLALEAYQDANRSIFQQDNRIVSFYKRGLSALDEPDKATGKVPLGRKALGTTARILLPIVKIPTNIVAETFQYATGLVTGSARLGRAFSKGTENLRPEEADLILRQLKKGSLGAAVMLLGYFSPNTVGGYYQQGEKRKKGDVKPGTVRMFGHDIPSFLLHNPLLETLQIGATVRRVADSKMKKRDPNTQGIGPGVWAGALGLTEQVPFVRETMETSKAFNPRERGQFVGELGRSLLVPQAVQWIAQHTDKDAKGNLIARKPKTAVQRVEEGIPGLRQNVPRNPKQPQP